MLTRIDELERSDLTPKKAFIIAAVDKEVRLSFAKRIRDTLPEAYYPLLSEGKFKDIPPFKFDKEDTPFASEGKEIYSLMKRKAPEEQIEPYIAAIQEQAANHGLDPILASTDVYVTAMCHNGAKSVSHITAGIDKSKERLQTARQESPAVGRQIVQSVVTYWKDQPGNAVNIVDKLLNYTIVTPDQVIEWALGPESLGNGSVLAQAWRYEIVAKTIGKVTTRVWQIVQAKVSLEVQAADADVDVEIPSNVQLQIQQMDDLLNSERQAMRQLFATIEDAVSGVASGAADGMVDSDTSEEDAALIKAWGEKWARVFRRKLAVEEARVGEAPVEAQLVSAKEQHKLEKARKAKEAEIEAAARAKEEEERAAKIAKEEAERAEKAEAEANGDAIMDGVDANGNGQAEEDLDVAE
jgi:nuclear cap-binding protein subunit 1